MNFLLYVAIFNEAQRVSDSLQRAVGKHQTLAGCLSSLTVFHRVADKVVDVGVVGIDDENGQLRVHSRSIDIDLLVRFLPTTASWSIVSSVNSFQFPETILNSRFSEYISVMVPVGTSSVFFIPPNSAIADEFVSALSADASFIMTTEMSPQDVATLRASLQKTR